MKVVKNCVNVARKIRTVHTPKILKARNFITDAPRITQYSTFRMVLRKSNFAPVGIDYDIILIL